MILLKKKKHKLIYYIVCTLKQKNKLHFSKKFDSWIKHFNNLPKDHIQIIWN